MLCRISHLSVEQVNHCMQKNTGLKRIQLAGVYAFNGIRAALRHEAAFRQEALLALVVLPVAFWLEIQSVERVLLVAVTVLVLIVELINSAVEAVVDRISSEHHLLSGRAKDMGSGAVMIALVLWLYVWVEIVVLGVWLA